MTEAAGDEFGVIWRRPDGIQTLSLYRMRDGLREYWDSSSIGLAWSGATFKYEPSADPESAGRLVVEWPDLTTGTPDCPTCPDHDMYRDSYRWDAARPVPVLTREEHLPDGLGPR